MKILRVVLILAAFWIRKADAFNHAIAFWQVGTDPQIVFAPQALGPSPSNDLSMRSVMIGGPGIISYKAVALSSGSCTDIGVAGALAAAPETSVLIPFTLFPADNSDNFICAIGKSVSGRWQSVTSPTTSPVLRIDTIPPVFLADSMSINSGDPVTDNNYVKIDLVATDDASNITQLCLKSVNSGGLVPAPSSCNWISVGPTTTGTAPSPTLALNQFDFLIGFSPGNYTVYAFAKDAAGNISVLSNSGNGTLGQDKASITYDPRTAPLVQNVVAGNSDAVTNPPSPAHTAIPAGTTVVIKWKATAENGFSATPIDLYYTTDDTNYVTIATGLPNGANGPCTLSADFTGCYVWANSSPTSGYFKVRVSATDLNGLVSVSMSPPVNTSNFQIIAGNTDTGLGGSAVSALFFNERPPEGASDPQSFVITKDGKFIFRDTYQGLLITDPADGIVRTLFPKSSSIVDGPFSVAKFRDPVALALDAQDRILVFDYDRIRRIDLEAQTVETIIGGGSIQAPGIPGTSFSIQIPNTQNRTGVHITVSPNGKIYFEALHQRQTPAQGNSLYYWDPADSKVYLAATAWGVGFGSNPTTDVSTTQLYRYVLGFDPSSGEIDTLIASLCYPIVGSTQNRLGNLDPATGVSSAPHPPNPSSPYCGHTNFFTDPAGEIWAVDGHYNRAYKYDKAARTWTKFLGTGVSGHCADGTLANNCDAQLSDIFVSGLGQIYFISRGTLRTIDSDGKVVTIYGQAFGSGDGGNPLDSRSRTITGLAITNSNEVIFSDREGVTLRSFQIGGPTINAIAGNGISANITIGGLAANNPINSSPGGKFAVDPVTGDIYTMENTGSTRLVRLNRSTGRWENVALYGNTYFADADGLPGSQIQRPHTARVVGFDGRNILVHLIQWSNGSYFDSQLKFYDTANNGTQSHFAGNNTATSSYSPDGTELATASVATPELVHFQYDHANSRWLMLYYSGSANNRNIRILPTTGSPAVISTLTTLPRAAISFHYTVNAGGEPVIYYCATNGKIYKYNVTTSVENELPIPNTMSCQSTPIVRSASRSSIIFTVTANNMSAIAEIFDVP